MQVRVKFQFINGDSVEITSEREGLIELYKGMNMKKMFILTDNSKKFHTAINPAHITMIHILKEKL